MNQADRALQASQARVYNFSIGPAVLPLKVLGQAKEEMVSWCDSGMNVMEMSHRGREFESILTAAFSDLRQLLTMPDNYRILFLQGGTIAESTIVPSNLTRRLSADAPKVDYIVTGTWSVKSQRETRKYGEVNIAATSEAERFHKISDISSWKLSSGTAYMHFYTNETIVDVEYQGTPGIGRSHRRVVISGVSSHILSWPIDWNDYQVLCGGAQKNIGPASLTIVAVRKDLLGHAHPLCPSAFNWRLVAENSSMHSTLSTYAIYIAGPMSQWIKHQGGIEALETRNIIKPKVLYDFIDASSFYHDEIHPTCRSCMDVPFFLNDESRSETFLAQTHERGLIQLKGHKSVGGMRASVYNAMPLEGVEALVDFMHDFERVSM